MLLGFGLSVSAEAVVREIPRDTSFTAYSTNIKIRKKHPEAVLAKPELPKRGKGIQQCRVYDNKEYTLR